MGQDTLPSLILDMAFTGLPARSSRKRLTRRADCVAGHPQQRSREGLLRLHGAPENRSLPVQGTRLVHSKQIKAWCWKAGVWEWSPTQPRAMIFAGKHLPQDQRHVELGPPRILSPGHIQPRIFRESSWHQWPEPTLRDVKRGRGRSRRVCGRLTVAADDPSPGHRVAASVRPHLHTVKVILPTHGRRGRGEPGILGWYEKTNPSFKYVAGGNWLLEAQP